MQHSLLQHKLQGLYQYPRLQRAEIERLGEILPELDDWQLFRINPLRFAREHGFDSASLLDIFIHGVKTGLFDFSWQLICPGCGGLEYAHASINKLAHSGNYCSVCEIEIDSSLDDQVEVAFSVNAGLRDLRATLQPLKNLSHYFRYFFSANYQPAPEVSAFLQDSLQGFYALAPDAQVRIEMGTLLPGSYRLLCNQLHAHFWLNVSEQQAEVPEIIEIDLLPGGFIPASLTIPQGTVTLSLHNRTLLPLGVLAWQRDQHEIRAVVSRYRMEVEPFYTGKQLLNHQSFRELFRIQSLDSDFTLNVRSLTLLFTDLKGSTALYDEIGDHQAYALVQAHFDLLTETVRSYNGSIVKTMGDAIMATFTHPGDGLQAALTMLTRMRALQARYPEHQHQLGLKIGLHEGPVLAVNADERLDYFGQSVNLAARVQGLAQAGELWLTDAIFNHLGIPDSLRAAGLSAESQSAWLKGISVPTQVWKCV
jgi:class 3 adenylate cyclase